MLVAYIIGISITPVEENVILLSTTTMFLYLTFWYCERQYVVCEILKKHHSSSYM